MSKEEYKSPQLEESLFACHDIIAMSLSGSTEEIPTNQFLETPVDGYDGEDVQW